MAKRANTTWRLIVISILIGAVLVAAKITDTRAQITSLLNFTGKVTGVDGSELSDGNYDMNFSIYEEPVGGAAVWTEDLTATTCFNGVVSGVTVTATGIIYDYTGETATGTLRVGQYLANASTSEGALIVNYDQSANTVTVASGSPEWSVDAPINNRPYVEGGIINVNLGAVSDISGVNFNRTLYLELAFNGETMQPRKILTPSASAFTSGRVGDKTEAELAGLADNETVTGEWSFNNILTIATSSDLAALTITQDGGGNIAEFKRGTTTAFAVLNDGRFQIGDYYLPASRTGSAAGYVLKIDVGGNMYWAPDLSGSGPGGADFLWATSTDGSLLFPFDTALITVIGNNATTTLAGQIFEVNGSSLFDMVNISNQQELRFYDADSSNYTALRATGTLSGNFLLTLPNGVGTAGQTLVTDGSGNLSWGSPTSFVYVNPGLSGQIPYYESGGSQLSATSSLFLNSAGRVGIGTSSPGYGLTLAGDLMLTGGIYDNSYSAGAAGAIIMSTGSGVNWVSTSTFIMDSDFAANGLMVRSGSGIYTSTSTLSLGSGGTGVNNWTNLSIPYVSGSAMAGLNIGTPDYVLAVNGSGTGYTWVSASSTGAWRDD
ncbi:MAG: hypothetical protein V1867_06310, partial [Candidatus Falkowbacteria bacterium]